AAQQLRVGDRTEDQKRADYEDFTAAVRRAIRAGVVDHPLVQGWISGQRSSGNWEALRKCKAGLERGSRHFLDAGDLWINITAVSLIETGCSFDRLFLEIRRRLKSEDFPGPIFMDRGRSWLADEEQELKKIRGKIRSRLSSRQNLHKRLLIRKSDSLIAPGGHLTPNAKQVQAIVRAASSRSS